MSTPITQAAREAAELLSKGGFLRPYTVKFDMDKVGAIIDQARAADQKVIDGLKEQLTRFNAVIGGLNGCRNEMANAFNQFGAARGRQVDEQPAAKMFWEADDKFTKWLNYTPGATNQQEKP